MSIDCIFWFSTTIGKGTIARKNIFRNNIHDFQLYTFFYNVQKILTGSGGIVQYYHHCLETIIET